MTTVALVAALVALPAQQPASFKNIQIAPLDGSRSAFEPSITVNKKDPANVVGGACMNSASYTTDGGKTWGETLLQSQYGVYGDPALTSDSDGNLYYVHLAAGKERDHWLDRIVCQKSTDGGKTWSDGASIGYNHPADQDKAWPVTDPTKPYVYVTWTQFDKYASRKPEDKSNIMFSASMDGGETFSRQVRINEFSGDCLDGDNTTEGAVPAVDKKGRIFVAWAWGPSIWFDRSYDGGKTWLDHDIEVTPIVGGWDMDIPGVGRANGMPVLVCDNSDGPNAGTLYILWADQRFGESDTDVFIVSSKDQGSTWSKPKRVNGDGAGKQQFFPWLAIDDTTGYLYAVYYDRRAYDDSRTDLYVAYSTDGAKTFGEKKISESPFTPTRNAFFGDYNNISAHAGVIAPIWTRMDDRKTTVWTAILKQADLIGSR
ncbi:MAG TPA: sialidase family protein [Fimbriimonadaceae bacterium]|nr:sialidase family protein [Fimbriimonadaceae bacterium]